MFSPGDLVAKKLRIVRSLGAGGMGVVYEAEQVHLGRRVAVKVIHPSEADSTEARARFIREARAQALLPLDHIVQVLDVDTLPDGHLYMVMEYLDGRDLKRELTKRGPLPVAEAVSYLIQACRGIAAAHAAGIVHRDLKPQNIFVVNLEGQRRVKLLDFGIAKVVSGQGPDLTTTSAAVGTPTYMAPEQIAGNGQLDGRVDLWALGNVLFELLTGRQPFRRETTASTLASILIDEPPPLHDFRDDVPPGLERVIRCCLAKTPDARFADAEELAAALAPYAAFSGVVRSSLRAPRGSSAPPAATVDVIGHDPLAPALPTSVHIPVSVDGLAGLRPGTTDTTEPIPLDDQGRAADAVAPPSLPTQVSAQQPPTPRRRRWALAAAGALVVLGGVATLLLPSPTRARRGAEPDPAAVAPDAKPRSPSGSTAVTKTAAPDDTAVTKAAAPDAAPAPTPARTEGGRDLTPAAPSVAVAASAPRARGTAPRRGPAVSARPPPASSAPPAPLRSELPGDAVPLHL
jgi:serine/threonine protein kinase